MSTKRLLETCRQLKYYDPVIFIYAHVLLPNCTTLSPISKGTLETDLPNAIHKKCANIGLKSPSAWQGLKSGIGWGIVWKTLSECTGEVTVNGADVGLCCLSAGMSAWQITHDWKDFVGLLHMSLSRGWSGPTLCLEVGGGGVVKDVLWWLRMYSDGCHLT